MSSSRPLSQFLDLARGVIGFLVAFFLYGMTSGAEVSMSACGPGLVISILTFWFCAERQESDPVTPWMTFIEQVSLSIGLNLIIQALLTYFLIYQHIPVFIIFVGGLLSSILLVAARGLEPRLPGNRGVLLVGFDPAAYELISSLRQPVLGVVEDDAFRSLVPEGLPVLGKAGQLAEIVSGTRPSRIVVTDRNWAARISARTLWNCRLAGIVVNDLPSLQENTLYRVSAEQLGPSDFVLSPALMSNRRAMAVQAIYTNLIGLLFLVVSVPLLVLIAIAVALSSGPGPIFEPVECLGFQNIPFHMFRFRTRRLGSSEVTAVGRIVAGWRLTNLPKLINVVRGEMALVGPSAVRSVFAARLTELMPFYSHRFTVKPGMIGWAELQLDRDGIPSETESIGYDLYYVKEGSPALDLEILMRLISGRRKAGRLRAAHR